MMTILNKTCGSFLIACLLVVSSNIHTAKAQRAAYRRANKYQKLAYMSQHPPIFFSTFTLPGRNDGQLLFTVTFNINYKRLTFLKANKSTNRGSFYSPTALNMDLFNAKKKSISHRIKLPKGFYPNRKSRHDHIDVSELSAIAHASWQDTAYASSYAQTESSKKSLSGSMQVQVQPGTYIYLIQPAKSESSQGFMRRVKVQPYSKTPVRNIILVKSVERNSPTRLQLMNLGHNVIFGKDFYVFIHLPDFKKRTHYLLKVKKIRKHEGNIQPIKTVYKQTISDKEVLTGIRPVLHSNAGGISLILKKNNDGYAYALVQIPNHNFANSAYKLILTNKRTSEKIAVDYYRSYWKNMPASLLSLDVAIHMMKYIASEQTINKIQSGSFQQRKKKFEEFWKTKDPTPKTPYNELQAEYYARIDSAYQKFTTKNTLGYKSSRGKVYILYGPPQHKQRTYPTDEPTTIVWTYPSRKFVFHAVSNFGDFKLVKTIK